MADHKQEDSIFEKVVTDRHDATAMITYCLYKLEKIAYFRRNPQIADEKEKALICHALMEGMPRIQRDAGELLNRVLNASMADYVRRVEPKSFWNSVWEGIVAGLVTLVAAPFLWLLLYIVLQKTHLWTDFLEMVNSFKTR